MLELKYVSKKYKKTNQIFKNINISFPEKGMYLVVGPSGVGKSTLLNIIGGMDSPTSGKMFFDNIEITKRNIDAYRNSYIGFVFQDFNLIASFSLKENLHLAFDLCNKKPSDNEINELLKLVGLPDNSSSTEEFLQKKPYELSVGQMQRFSIARALIKDPKILLLDEPTSSLDEKNANIIFKLLKDLSKSKLIIISSHNKTLFEKESDQVISINNGNITLEKENIDEKDQQIYKNKTHHGFFSFIETLKIALFNLKHKKIRLISSLIVTTIVAVLFGAACIFQTCEKDDALLRTQIQNNVSGSFITRMHSYYNHSSYFKQYEQVEFTDSQIKEIYNFSVTTGFFDGINLNTQKINQITNYIISSSDKYIELNSSIDPSVLGLTRYKNLEENTISRIPTSPDEIAISSLYANLMLKNGFFESNNSELSDVIYVEKIDDIIGHKLFNGLTIVGIFSTDDGVCEYMEPFISLSDDELEMRDDHQEIMSIKNGASLTQYMYTCENFHKTNSNPLGRPQQNPYSFYIRMKGNYSSDKNFLSAFKEDSYFLHFSNYFSGFATFIDAFSGVFQQIAWITITILLIISFATTLSLFYGNVKSMEHDLGIYKSMGASKWSISSIVLTQSFIIGLVEFIVATICLAIFAAILNAKYSIAILALNIPTVLLLFLILVVIGLLVSLLSAKKAIIQKPKVIIQNK